MKEFNLNLKRISYLVTNTCNLHCTHCFQNVSFRHKHFLDPEDAFKATKFAVDNNISNSKEIEITIIGGEPILYNKFLELKNTFQYMIDSGYIFSIVRIFSNGTKINYELIELLNYIKPFSKEINFYFTKDILEKYPSRIDHLNLSQNSLIDKTVSILNKLGFNIYFQYLFSPSDVKHFPEILDEIIVNKDISLDFIYPQINDFSKKDFDFIIQIFNSKIHKIDRDIFYRSGLRIYYDIITGNILYKEKQNDNYIRCNPIKGEFSISPKGYIIPCVKVLEMEEEFKDFHIDIIIENPNSFFNNKELERYINYEDKNEKLEKCQDCIFDGYCHECRLFPSLIKLQNGKHIEHSDIQCNRMKLLVEAIESNLGDFDDN